MTSFNLTSQSKVQAAAAASSEDGSSVEEERPTLKSVSRKLESMFEMAMSSSENEEEEEAATVEPPLTALELARRRRNRLLGRFGLAAEALTIRKSNLRKQNYSVSLVSAIAQDRVVANQLIEGGVDSAVFENFLQQMLLGLRKDKSLDGRNIVLLLDNAKIHHHSLVLETARRMEVNVLFNAEYSPWLNPVESLFAHLKRSIKEEQITTR